MITTSTLISDSSEQKVREAEVQLPEFAVPSDGLIKSLLNYSRSLEVKKSGTMDLFEIVKT